MSRGFILSELTLITLPIGNTGDITLRALEALRLGKTFYAEDTRVFKQLLDQLGIPLADKFIDSFHDKSIGKIEVILEKLKKGEAIYLVSDAGSPMISDPAYPLLKRLLDEGVVIKTLPGVTAVVTALELSGLPPHPFHFWGFISRTKGEKKNFFKELEAVSGTHIFFESPHRIYETVETFFEVHPSHVLVIARELTKTYESVYRLTRDDLGELKSKVLDKGEFVVLFHSEEKKGNSLEFEKISELMRDYLDNGGSPKKLAKIFSTVLNLETKAVYDQLTRSAKS